MKNTLITLLLRERRIIISGLICGAVSFLIYLLFFYTPLYSTTAKLFIRNIPKTGITASYGGTSTLKSESGFSNPLFNFIKILTSKSTSYKAYDVLKENYPKDLKRLKADSKENWHKAYENIISAKVEPSSDIIEVKLNWVDRYNAPEVLNKTIEEFKNVNLEIRKSIEQKQSEYIDNQLESISNKLDQARNRIKEYKIENKAVDISNQTTELVKIRMGMENQIENIKSRIKFNEKKLANLSANLNFPNVKTALKATAVGQDPYLVDLNQKLAVLEQNYAGLQTRFTENYPDLIEVKNEIISLETNINARKSEILQGTQLNRAIYDKSSQKIVDEMSEIQAEKNSLKSQLVSLQTSLGGLLKKESQLPAKVLGLESLLKEENALLSAYSSIKARQLEARIKENEIVDNIFMIDSPSVPDFNFLPIVIKLFSFLSLGFLGALSLVWVKDDIEDKWTSVQEMEEFTSEKVLGILPWNKLKEITSQNVIYKLNTVNGIAYKNIASNIISKSAVEKVKSISFVSTSGYRESSSIAPNIAHALARADRSVVLIDTDFSKPNKIFRKFNLELPKSKRDILDIMNEFNFNADFDFENSEKADAFIRNSLVSISVQSANKEKISFYYLGASRKADISEHVGSKGFKTLINILKKSHDHVLIDTPSMPLVFPEMREIVQASDSTMLIPSASTSRKKLMDVISDIKQLNARILGLIPREENSELQQYFEKKVLHEVREVNVAQNV